MPPRYEINPDDTFDRWTVIKRLPSIDGNAMYECCCSCGTVHSVAGRMLFTHRSRSCGCLQRDTAKTHGKARTPIYLVWRNMKNRCLLPTNKDYKNYGARGVTVHPEWITSFATFYAHVGDPPSPKHTLDRYPDNNGNYEPGNVRWATQRQQLANRRVTKTYTYDGVTKTLSDWARQYNVEPEGLGYRLFTKKMPFLAAVTTPRRPYRRKV